MIDVGQIKKLREMTGVGMMAAKSALVESDGDMDKAMEVLRKNGAGLASKRINRDTNAGVIESYVHAGRIGVLVEVNCETDFVQRTGDFKELAKNIAMQIAATSPEFVSSDEVPEAIIKNERKLYAEEAAGKPSEVVSKMVEGKLEKYYDTVCLLRQPFIKDPDKRVEELIAEVAVKTGENIVVRRFTRIELGQVD